MKDKFLTKNMKNPGTGKEQIMCSEAEVIKAGKAVLGIEFGSTRIKAVLVDPENRVIGLGTHDWENRLVDGLWTYTLEDIWGGLQDCYTSLSADVQKRYGVVIEKLAAVGFSAMMHGYMAFGSDDELLIPFRTWRNTNTGKAAAALTKLFNFNMPMRWSTSHLYQCILDGMDHVKKITYYTTLAGYITWALTGNKVIGVGDAAGMFPIDPKTRDFDERMIGQFDELVKEYHYPWKLRDIMPKVLVAGQQAGTLTEKGARLLDVSGHLQAGVPVCPPEGDAGTGMVATNSCEVTTGNVSAGTSVFAMVVMKENIDLYILCSGPVGAFRGFKNADRIVEVSVLIFQHKVADMLWTEYSVKHCQKFSGIIIGDLQERRRTVLRIESFDLQDCFQRLLFGFFVDIAEQQNTLFVCFTLSFPDTLRQIYIFLSRAVKDIISVLESISAGLEPVSESVMEQSQNSPDSEGRYRSAYPEQKPRVEN